MTIRVLIVEDDHRTGSLLRYVVEALDTELVWAESVDEARCRAPWADIAVVDRPNDGSVIELLEELRAMNPDVAVVCMTDDAVFGARARRAGAARCLTGPVSVLDLHAAIDQCRPSGAAHDDLGAGRHVADLDQRTLVPS